MDYFKLGRLRHLKEITLKERHQMIKEYLSGNLTKVEVWRKYTGQLNEHGSLLRLMRMYGYLEKSNSTPNHHISSIMESTNTPIDNEQLILKIQELEKQLEETQLKKEAYRLLIEEAESTFKINIRKKSDTK